VSTRCRWPCLSDGQRGRHARRVICDEVSGRKEATAIALQSAGVRSAKRGLWVGDQPTGPAPHGPALGYGPEVQDALSSKPCLVQVANACFHQKLFMNLSALATSKQLYTSIIVQHRCPTIKPPNTAETQITQEHLTHPPNLPEDHTLLPSNKSKNN
jgi:hypothetical protein